MKICFSALLALTIAVVLSSASTAQAGGIVTNTQNTIHYLDGEQLATYDNVNKIYTATTSLAVGNHLYGVSKADSELPGPNPTGSTAFDIVIAKIIDPTTGASVDPTNYTGTVELLFTSDSTTGPGGGGFLTGTGTYTLADGSSVSGLGANANTLDALYQGSSLSLATINTGSQAAAIAAATDGTSYGNFGLGANLSSTSDNSQWGAAGVGYWASDVTLNNGQVTSAAVPFPLGLNDLSTLPPGVGGFTGELNPQLSLQQGGEATGADGTSIHNNDLGIGSTTFAFVGGGHATTDPTTPFGVWATSSSDPLYIHPNPEPGTLVMLCSGLAAGVPWLRRRRKSMLKLAQA